MKAWAGAFPGSQTIDTNKQYNDKGNLKSSFSIDKDTGWALGAGYYYKSGGKKRASGKKTVYDLDDKAHKFTVWEHDDTRGFHRNFTVNEDILERAEHAFDTSRDNFNPNSVHESDGCGHIKHLKYASEDLVLRVEFENGDVCVFFGVPHAVAGTLFHHARSKATRGVHMHGSKKGKPRHVLGIEFWDLVRIRGNHYGARYQFEYEAHSDGKFTSFGDRHFRHDSYGNLMSMPRTLDDYNLAENLLAKSRYGVDKDIQARFEAVMNSDIYKEMLDDYIVLEGVDTAEDNDMYDALMIKAKNKALKKAVGIVDPDLSKYIRLNNTGFRSDISYDTGKTVTADMAKRVSSDDIGHLAAQDAYAKSPLQNVTLGSSDVQKRRLLNRGFELATGESANIYSSLKKQAPALAAQNQPRKVITRADLTDKYFDKSLLGNLYDRYAKLIQRGDYQGAFNLLTSKKHTVVYKNKKGVPKSGSIKQEYFIHPSSVFEDEVNEIDIAD